MTNADSKLLREPRQRVRQMHFRTVADLFGTVRRNAHRIPSSVDLIVGIPRSGLLAACAVSLAIHRPMTDLQSFLSGRVYGGSSRLGGRDENLASNAKSVLVVDDSIFMGSALREAKELIEATDSQKRFTYAAIYGLKPSHPEVDLVFEVCPSPRVFEWNAMNYWSLEYACVDMDGVLCVDPTHQENDDGANYKQFLETAALLNAPRFRIDSIVTSRLEKYRAQTEAWLSANGIKYNHLFMLDLPSAEERLRLGIHAKFKADVYKNRRKCLLFIESELSQAREIRALSGKSVLAYRDMQYFPENAIIKTTRNIRQIIGRFLPQETKKRLKAKLRM